MKSIRNFQARRTSEPGRGGRRLRVTGALLLAVLAASGACSLLVESSTDQCKTDAECSAFGDYSVCNAGVCVKPSSVDDAGSDGGNCFTGAPTKDPEFFNQCTDAGCEPFDNCVRLGLCSDAGLPPLVSPDGGS
ncbi:MAG: hypothetical protein ABI134_05010 [Byssovorax sp.]